MTLTDLSIFYAVADAKGFSSAAKILDLPTANVSRRIIQLEKELSFNLFRRTTRSVELTEEGLIYYQKSKELYEQHLQLTEELLANKHSIHGKVRVQLLPESKIIMPYLQKFQELHPEIVLDLLISSENLNLLEHGIDLAIKIGELQDSSFICRKLDTVERCFMVSPAFMQRSGHLTSAAALSTANCLRFRTSDGKVESDWHVDANQTISVSGNLISNDIGLLHEACLLGQGVALLPKVLCEADLATGKLLQIFAVSNPYKYDLWLLYTDKKYQNEVNRALIDFITDIKNG